MFCLFVARRFVAIKSEFSLASSFVFVFFCKLCTYLKIEYDKSDEYIIIYKPLLQDGGIDRECDKEWTFKMVVLIEYICFALMQKHPYVALLLKQNKLLKVVISKR